MNLKFAPPFDPGFQPAALTNREYAAAAKKSGKAVPLVIGLERENKLISRFETVVRADAGAETLRYAGRTVKFLPWAFGGWRTYVGGRKPSANSQSTTIHRAAEMSRLVEAVDNNL